MQQPLVCGGLAGLTVDLSLFPLDTIKTRLQSERGFLASGGVRGVYSGVSVAALGSAPTSAAFFLAYDGVKAGCGGAGGGGAVWTHMVAASVGEVVACVLRVPVEVLKQRAQAAGGTTRPLTVATILRTALTHEGYRGLYRGYWSTVCREVPFSIIQFPLWEALKRHWLLRLQEHDAGPSVLMPWQSALCGAVAGGCAAAATTPLDVCKTRIMLAPHNAKHATSSLLTVLNDVYKQEGIAVLFSGLWPRLTMISAGGFIFLGAYDTAKYFIYNT